MPLSRWLALAGTVAAFAGAALVSGLTTPAHHAEAELVVVRGGGPLKPGRLADDATRSLARLLDSNLIAADVVANLHLTEQPEAVRRRIHSSAVAPGLLRVRVDAAAALRAQQIAQEVTLVFPQLVAARFHGPDALRATIWDPAHAAGSTTRGWGTSLGSAAAAAAFLWLLALAPWRRRRLALPKVSVPSVSLPRPALPRREPRTASNTLLQTPEAPEFEAPPAIATPPVASNTLLQAPEVPVPAAAAPDPEGAPPDPEAAPPTNGGGAHFNLIELESLVDGARSQHPDRALEWDSYVFFLRDHAAIDGSLPANFDSLVEDVFAELLTGRR